MARSPPHPTTCPHAGSPSQDGEQQEGEGEAGCPGNTGGLGGARGAQWVWERVQILAGVPAFPGVSGQVLPASPKAPAEVAQRMAGGEESRSWAAWGQPNMPQRGPHL